MNKKERLEKEHKTFKNQYSYPHFQVKELQNNCLHGHCEYEDVLIARARGDFEEDTFELHWVCQDCGQVL